MAEESAGSGLGSRSSDAAEGSPGRVGLRWRLAGLLHRLPEFRGRDRISHTLVGGQPRPAGLHTGRFGPGLRFRAVYSEDGGLMEFFFLQYEAPALAPVLEACLAPGDVFFDVGANVGIYSAWASRLVGSAGEVHGFEPIPSTRAYFEDLVALNQLDNVRIVASALGAEQGETELWLNPGASGNTAAFPRSEGAVRVPVRISTLDLYSARADAGRLPRLVKIDVEGFEFDVLRGADALLRDAGGPAVVYETWSEGGVAGADPDAFAEIAVWLAERGYEIHGLTPAGLVRIDPVGARPRSLNTLALHPERHAGIARRLARTRFRRNQNC